MQQVITSLLLIALGMAVDAWYQHKLRIAECNAYETGYQQGKHEERIREEERAAQAGLVTVQTIRQWPLLSDCRKPSGSG